MAQETPYDAKELNRALLPPPRILPYPDTWPVIEPPFRDHRADYAEEAEAWEVFESAPLRDADRWVISDEMAGRAREAALVNDRVRELLSGKRYLPIGAGILLDKGSDARPLIQVVIYDYHENRVVEARLDYDSLDLLDVAVAYYQPAPLEQEIERALELARHHEALKEHIATLHGTAILVTMDDPAHPQANHRMFDVRFGCADERLPRYAALVDLSSETVIRAGRLNGPCEGDSHE